MVKCPKSSKKTLAVFSTVNAVCKRRQETAASKLSDEQKKGVARPQMAFRNGKACEVKEVRHVFLTKNGIFAQVFWKNSRGLNTSRESHFVKYQNFIVKTMINKRIKGYYSDDEDEVNDGISAMIDHTRTSPIPMTFFLLSLKDSIKEINDYVENFGVYENNLLHFPLPILHDYEGDISADLYGYIMRRCSRNMAEKFEEL